MNSSAQPALSTLCDRRDFLRTTLLGGIAVGASTTAANAFAETPAPPSAPAKPTASTGPTFSLRREIPVWSGFDVVVAGGGPAGVAAAISASRLGAKVLLVEAMGCLGGMGTSGLVTAFDPMGNGETNLVRGIMREAVLECAKIGALTRPDPEDQLKRYRYWTPFRPEGYKLVLDRMVANAGVTSRFFTRVIDADADPEKGVVRGVVIQNVSGYKYVPARAFVDCTGDAVLAELVGAPYHLAGRDTPKIMPPTLAMHWSNFSEETLKNFAPTYRKFYDDKNYFPYPDPKLVGLKPIGNSYGYLNGGHLFDTDATNDEHLTRAMMKGREIADGFRRLIQDEISKIDPSAKNVELIATASLLGVRETRRILGEYELSENDLLTRREFPDAIGYFCKYSDIHLYEPTPEAYQAHLDLMRRTNPQPGETMAIPYGAIVPKAWTNLWVPGRAASADLIGQGAIRVQPYCSMMGEAAGTAAVQHLRTGQPAHDLNTATLVDTLRERGAYLPQKTTSATMTRA